ncbi:MAG: HRDC domain-containing protein [bacterium]
MSLKGLIAGILGIEDNSEIYYSKGYNKGFADGYAKAQKEFAEKYDIIDDEQDYADGLTEKEEKIFKKLKSWRYIKARKLHLETYMILHDAELISAIKAKPQDTDELIEIKGYGEKNVAKYGKELIRIINKEI